MTPILLLVVTRTSTNFCCHWLLLWINSGQICSIITIIPISSLSTVHFTVSSAPHDKKFTTNKFSFQWDPVKCIAFLRCLSCSTLFFTSLQYHKEVTRLVTGQHRAEVTPMLVNLARMWMKFVQTHYSHGKGSRPRWSNAGLDFIVFVCNPHNTRYLSEQDFQVRDVKHSLKMTRSLGL